MQGLRSDYNYRHFCFVELHLYFTILLHPWHMAINIIRWKLQTQVFFRILSANKYSPQSLATKLGYIRQPRTSYVKPYAVDFHKSIQFLIESVKERLKQIYYTCGLIICWYWGLFFHYQTWKIIEGSWGIMKVWKFSLQYLESYMTLKHLV